MITLGMLIGAIVKGNPNVVVMATEKVAAGTAKDVLGIKISETGPEKKQVIVLTI